jgi:hypothetical protein
VGPTLENEDERTVFLDAIEESLRPLMRLVFKYGVSYQDLIDAVRGLYVAALRERLIDQGRNGSVARLGLVSGVSRGEITKLFESRDLRAQQRELATKRIDELSQLLSHWHDDSRFSTPYGAPLDLSFTAEGSFRTFAQLHASSGIELSLELSLEYLSKAGCVEIHGDDFVRCVNRTLISPDSDSSRIARLGRSAASLNATLVRNLFSDSVSDSFFERTTLSDFPLSESGRQLMLALLREEGANFINELDRWVSGKETEIADLNGRKYGVTMFFFEESESADFKPQFRSLGKSAVQ